MVLSDREIRAEIQNGTLSFTPPATKIDSSSVEMRLHPSLITFPQSNRQAPPATPADPDFQVGTYIAKHGTQRSLTGDPYTFEPGQMIIGKTLEYVVLPPYLAARIEGKSSLARLGLSIHITAPTVMAGFEGTLYLEMYNWGPRAIQLRENMNIAQLILERVGEPPDKPYGGQFQGQI